MLEADDELYVDEAQALLEDATGLTLGYYTVRRGIHRDLGFTKKVVSGWGWGAAMCMHAAASQIWDPTR
jgi:hypothetical protein